MFVRSNIDVPQHYTSCQFCSNVTQFLIDRGIIAPGHGKEVVDGLNVISKRYIYQLMSTVKLPGSKTFDLQNIMHSLHTKK